ncbi:hypothetical protein F2Q70_00045014 [Brassica cretica]|uniref:Uncharacterized protein n=1 Tax=Brassica cretica TaxID=69181 RepID=A0A8S9KH46_BRACR|nr:hypothetical protein F2Q70_00045014 [Brassica cretica]
MDEGELELAKAYNEELDKPEICNGDGAVWARNEKEKEDDALEESIPVLFCLENVVKLLQPKMLVAHEKRDWSQVALMS